MRIVVGVTGASGVILAEYLLRTLRESGCETQLLITDAARTTWAAECDRPLSDLIQAADRLYDNADLAAAIASGSYAVDGMVILPCSMKTLAGVVSGYSETLLLRAADVTLKEGRTLILCPRESPLSRVHLRNLQEAGELGCVIMPPLLTFYHRPRTWEEMAEAYVGRIAARLGVKTEKNIVWTGLPEPHGKGDTDGKNS